MLCIFHHTQEEEEAETISLFLSVQMKDEGYFYPQGSATTTTRTHLYPHHVSGLTWALPAFTLRLNLSLRLRLRQDWSRGGWEEAQKTFRVSRHRRKITNPQRIRTKHQTEDFIPRVKTHEFIKSECLFFKPCED